MLQAAYEYMHGFVYLFATHHAACKQTGLLLSHLACIAQFVFCRLQWHFLCICSTQFTRPLQSKIMPPQTNHLSDWVSLS